MKKWLGNPGFKKQNKNIQYWAAMSPFYEQIDEFLTEDVYLVFTTLSNFMY